MKKTLHILCLLLPVLASSCKGKEPPLQMTCKTVSATDIGETTAVLKGTVTVSGISSGSLETCFYLGTDVGSLKTVGTILSGGFISSQGGGFSAVADNLEPGTKYYYAASAFTEGIVSYGDVMTFETKPRELVKTLGVSEVKYNSAVLSGFADLEHASTSEFGFLVSKSENPTTDNSIKYSGKQIGNDNTYTVLADNLEDGVTYFFRAFVGSTPMRVGEVLSFSTLNYTPVSSISLNYNYLEVEKNETAIIIANVEPNDATDKTVVWFSSNTAVATVDQDGNVKGISIGDAIVSASCGDQSASCTVRVVEAVSSIRLSPTSMELSSDEEKTIIVSIEPKEAAARKVQWSSSDQTVVTVDENGRAKGVNSGNAIITASVGGKSATCSVDVIVPVASLTLSPSSLELAIGDTQTIIATVLPDNATDKTVTWYSTNTKIVIVDNDGAVTGLRAGEATIYASVGVIMATCSIIVKDESPIISFADDKVKQWLINSYDTNHDGEISQAEAAAISDLYNAPNDIESFEEFQYFVGLDSLRQFLFSGCEQLGSISLPNTVLSIGHYCFSKCTSLSSISIPESVTTIGDWAFALCKNLSSVVFPESLISIGEKAFTCCSKLQEITLPNSVVSIGKSCFSACYALESVILSNSLKALPDECFEACNSLERVSIPNSVQEIGYGCFVGDNLEHVDLGEGVEKLSDLSIITQSRNFTSIRIPASLKIIGRHAVSAPLSSITVMATNPPVAEDEPFNIWGGQSLTIYVPSASVNAYKTAQYWSNYADKIQAIP